MEADKDWKKSVGFPINYSPDESEDDPDRGDVVMRRPRQTEILLTDCGDGAEADLLGTTPPRERIRDKQKRRAFMDSLILGPKRSDSMTTYEQSPVNLSDRPRNTRLSLKIRRAKDRDFKQDKAFSLPSPNPAVNATPSIPTLVESCNRFMCLSSRLKHRRSGQDPPEEAERRCEEEFPPNRVNFHNMFSMLINMGNAEKGCRRTISREEQVWQNELKDLIWLELQAKIGGRTLAEQDAFLVAQRNIVPTIVQNIQNYRFVNTNPCPSRSRRLGVIEGSTEDLTQPNGDIQLDEPNQFCLSFNCQPCIDAVGAAMREVGTLLDSYYNASALYPSSHGMVADHPTVATQLFKHRLKAMCLWYNTALHMRLKLLAVRRMIRTMKLKSRRRTLSHFTSTDSDYSRQTSENRPCQVRFNVSNTPSDSNNSDSSGQNDVTKFEETTNEVEQTEQIADNSIGERKVSRDEGNVSGDEDTKDEIDSSCDKKLDQSTPTTPEIIISDSKYGTSDTVTSTESGYTSSLDSDYLAMASETVYDIGSLRDITRLRLLNKCQVSIYRSYHYEMLKIQGVRRCMQFINKMRKFCLNKVYYTLEKPSQNVKKEPYTTEDETAEVFEDTREDEDKSYAIEDDDETYELRRFGCWSEECLSMGLPSYRNHFLLLSSICMEAVHDYLSLRLEDRPINPSCLTVKQLIHELKEGLDIATEMRATFAKNIEAALAGQTASEEARNDLLLIIRTFDATIETVLKQYLSYLKTMSEVDEMGKVMLQAEWTFTARLAKRVKCAALLAPVTFSEIVCNQLERIRRQFADKFEKISEFGKNTVDPNKQFVYAICRAVQDVYASERDVTLQTVQFARMLAVRLARAPPPAYRPQRAAIFENLMKIRDLIVSQTYVILERSSMKYEECGPMSRDAYDILSARIRELMLQIYRVGFELHKELYKLARAPFQLVQEKSHRRRPVSLQPLRPHYRERGRRKRPETMIIHESINPMIHKELHKFVEESPKEFSKKSSIAPKARGLRLMRSDSMGDDADTNVFDISSFGNSQSQSSIELLLTGAKPDTDELSSTPVAEDLLGAEERQWATRVARAVVEAAKCWMQFVIERCDKGRGLRPRWASQGLEFLMLACDPCNTKHLTEEEFEDLKKQMDGCISHVIGSRPVTPRIDTASSSPDLRPRRPRLHGPLSSASSNSSSRSVPAPPTPPTEPDPLLNFAGVDFAAHSQRVYEATKRIEEEREQKLQEMKAVGRVLEATVLSYEPKLRQLKFKWQRGLKIGAGTFGKVYTVVNTETGQLLAMKEISIGAGDRRALQRAANELKVLEGVIHPHLVRYYGCELHREEMLLFMELCVEGSLEALIATSGALEELMVRRYTKQLVSAVTELHSRSIAHRDIKSGNIFLTNEGHCLKLGDFGSAVKIRANTTAAGELMGHVGTQAYMAPEVFMKSTGHGRAADIWSLGCVVTEMASGKRPFSEYDSNVQIMFVVGMGGRPHIPETLSEEGQQFCLACLTHEPEARPKAEALGMHHFLKLQSDEECNCEPAYLIA